MITSEIVKDLYEEAQQRFSAFDDPAHGWEHVQRVYHLGLRIAKMEGADLFIVGAAALLHDLGRLVPRSGKPHAQLSVEQAHPLLERYQLEQEQIGAVLHAIEAHSFRHGIKPHTLEARVVHDADRLDGLGAIGILRWAITGTMKRQPQTRCYHPEDPFGEQRQLDEALYMLDHFSTRLLKLEESMTTETGRVLAQHRSAYMRQYLQVFKEELEFGLPLE